MQKMSYVLNWLGLIVTLCTMLPLTDAVCLPAVEILSYVDMHWTHCSDYNTVVVDVCDTDAQYVFLNWPPQYTAGIIQQICGCLKSIS